MKRLLRVARKLAVPLMFVAAVVLSMAWLLGAFRTKIDPNQETGHGTRPLQGQEVVSVRRELRPRREQALGTVRAVHESSVAAKLLSTVTAVHVRAGQSVAAGELLIELDDAEHAARLRQAQAHLEAARATVDQSHIDRRRVRELHAQNVASDQERDHAETAVRTAEADLERAQRAVEEAQSVLEWTKIRATFAGVVFDRQVETGDTVVPGQVLVALFDPEKMQLVASVRESLRDRLSVGDRVQVDIDALGESCEGTVSEIVPASAAGTRSFDVKITGPCPPGAYSGMFGRLWVPLEDEAVLLIPADSVRRVGQIELVDVVVGEQLHRRAVRTGRRFGASVEVLSGLRAEESVAVPAEGPTP